VWVPTSISILYFLYFIFIFNIYFEVVADVGRRCLGALGSWTGISPIFSILAEADTGRVRTPTEADIRILNDLLLVDLHLASHFQLSIVVLTLSSRLLGQDLRMFCLRNSLGITPGREGEARVREGILFEFELGSL
jgi:hypothetical protein